MRNHLLLHYAVWIILYVISFCCLHTEIRAADNLIFKHFNLENGLSQSTVRCIQQDDFGFMWFGTKDGLNRFDGLNFKIYRHIPNDDNSIGSNYIYSLCEGENGNIWIGTDVGLYLYNAEMDNFIHLSMSAQDGTVIDQEINDIKRDDYNNLWIAAGTLGIFRYDIAKGELFHFEAPVGEMYAKCIDIDKKRHIWVGTLHNGLYFYNYIQDNFDKWQTQNYELGNYNINSLLCSEDRMYIGTSEAGLLVMTNNKSIDPINLERNFSDTGSCLVHTLYRKSSTELLIGTEGGLCLYNEITKETIYYTHQLGNLRSISDNAIYSIYKDREQGIWVGTYFDGINYLPYQFSPFTHYYPQQNTSSIKGERVREICQDYQGRVWIGTEDNGLSCFDTSTQKMICFPFPASLSPAPFRKNVHGLTCDERFLWIGYYNGGIDRYDLTTGKVTHLFLSELLGYRVNEDIFSLYRSFDDNLLWIGTVRGVYIYNTHSGDLSPVRELGNVFVYDIKRDNKGHFWIATMNSGVICYDPDTQKSTHYHYDDTDERSISSNKILSICITSLGEIWFTTEGGGLCKYNEETDDFTRITEENGLPNNVVYMITEDIDKNLWFGTNKGLVRMNPVKKSIQVYMNSDGLISNQFNYKSGFMDRDGTLYFGTVKGMITFNPHTFVENNYKPSVALTSFSVFNNEMRPGEDSPLKQSINTTKTITLHHTQSTLSFEFVTLSFAASEQNKYAYKMDGIDKEWIKLDRSNRVSYSNLPPGKYTFRMKGANSYGIWSEEEKNVHLHIRPPFYLSNMAYVFYLFLLLTGLYGLYILLNRRFVKKHNQQIQEIETQKEKEAIRAKIDFFTNITHEIRTPLTLISSPLEYLLENESMDSEVRDTLMIMHQNTDRLLQLSNQLLDFQRVENLGFQLSFINTNICQLLADTYRRYQPVFEEKGIVSHLILPENTIYAKVDVEALIKIISNLLSNAFKFTRSTVTIELKPIHEKENLFIVSVENDGEIIADELQEKIFEPFYQIKDNGDTPSVAGSGLGLSLSRKLAELHEGKLYYEKTTSQQNRFVMLLPFNLDEETEENKTENLSSLQEEEIGEEPASENEYRSSILIVEDNEELLNFLAKRLQKEYQVYTSLNGKEALSKLETIEPDLIICDLMMPQLDGFGLLKELKSNYQFSHIPVVILTAKNNLKSKIQSLEYGADAYIEKPFSYTHLQVQIVNLIQKRKEVKQLFRLYPVSSFNSLVSNSTDEKFLKKANDVIEKNLDNSEMNIEMLSIELGVSKSTLNRKLRGLCELSANEYIRVYRLKKAVTLLKSGEYRVNEVAFLTGFSSSSYFAKCFQRQFGALPKEYTLSEPDNKE